MRGATPPPASYTPIRPTPKRFPFLDHRPRRNETVKRFGVELDSKTFRRRPYRTHGETFSAIRPTAKRFRKSAYQQVRRNVSTPFLETSKRLGPIGETPKRFPTAGTPKRSGAPTLARELPENVSPSAPRRPPPRPNRRRRNVSGLKRFGVAATPTPKRFHSRHGETFPARFPPIRQNVPPSSRRHRRRNVSIRGTAKRFPGGGIMKRFAVDLRRNVSPHPATPKRFRISDRRPNVSAKAQRFVTFSWPRRPNVSVWGVKRFPVSPVARGRDGETFPDRFAP